MQAVGIERVLGIERLAWRMSSCACACRLLSMHALHVMQCAQHAACLPSCSPQAAGEVQWAAFYSDCLHEVLPVIEGARVTLAWELFAHPGKCLPSFRQSGRFVPLSNTSCTPGELCKAFFRPLALYSARCCDNRSILPSASTFFPPQLRPRLSCPLSWLRCPAAPTACCTSCARPWSPAASWSMEAAWDSLCR